ncbi:MarR family EPS-associated transcriptional regulator [Thermomonas paludicola]|uniref:MarR family EPS-associated transcriptional regulator n=1 Tax=Thermomonas paludicola TaxID=2884874 RepID=UPI002114351A|nr:MarR family EPS-associated transcriptional regulator [Thermomonas paludicola]
MTHPTDELSVAILRRLADSPQLSQRDLARHTGVSLGKINYVLRALIDKGWVKAGNFSRSPHKLGYAYLLTPHGIDAKARLTRRFLERKMREYDTLRVEIQHLQNELDAEQGVRQQDAPSTTLSVSTLRTMK